MPTVSSMESSERHEDTSAESYKPMFSKNNRIINEKAMANETQYESRNTKLNEVEDDEDDNARCNTIREEDSCDSFGDFDDDDHDDNGHDDDPLVEILDGVVREEGTAQQLQQPITPSMSQQHLLQAQRTSTTSIGSPCDDLDEKRAEFADTISPLPTPNAKKHLRRSQLPSVPSFSSLSSPPSSKRKKGRRLLMMRRTQSHTSNHNRSSNDKDHHTASTISTAQTTNTDFGQHLSRKPRYRVSVSSPVSSSTPRKPMRTEGELVRQRNNKNSDNNTFHTVNAGAAITNFQDYLRLQQMQSSRRFQQTWDLGDSHHDQENEAEDSNSMQSLTSSFNNRQQNHHQQLHLDRRNHQHTNASGGRRLHPRRLNRRSLAASLSPNASASSSSLLKPAHRQSYRSHRRLVTQHETNDSSGETNSNRNSNYMDEKEAEEMGDIGTDGEEQSSELGDSLILWPHNTIAKQRTSNSRRPASAKGITNLAQSSDWVEFLDRVHDIDEEGDIDDDPIEEHTRGYHHHHRTEYGGNRKNNHRRYFDGLYHDDADVSTPFYCQPHQRQRWGAKQVLPHINWADLFFDLFFVALASNLGTLLTSVLEDPRHVFRGIIYFVGCFGPLFNSWENKVKYEARYTVHDHVHVLLDVLRFFVIGFAVLHVKSIKLLSDPHSIETFSIALCIYLDSILSIILNLELYFVAEGDRTAIQNSSRRKILHNLLFDSFYFTAMVLAGVFYFTEVADFEIHQDTVSNSDTSTAVIEPHDEEKPQRYLAIDPIKDDVDDDIPMWRLADLPLTLCCGSYLLRILAQIGVMHYHNTTNKTRDFQNYFVPHNIEFMIHRYGEWVMLMIGESVLALLIVDTTESRDYYVVTTIGILTVIVLQILKYESEPRKPSRHALLRSTTSGLCYSISIQMFSMTLMSFGISFKVFLLAIFLEQEAMDDGKGKEVGSTATVIDEDTAAQLYCISLTLVLLSLECLHLSHSSLRQNFDFGFLLSGGENKSKRFIGVLSAITKLALLLFIATLSIWETDPVFLTVAGCVVTCIISVSRVFFTSVYNEIQLRTVARKHNQMIQHPPKHHRRVISVDSDTSHLAPRRPSSIADDTIASG